MRYSCGVESNASYRYGTNTEPADTGTRLAVTIHARPLCACASAFDAEAPPSSSPCTCAIDTSPSKEIARTHKDCVSISRCVSCLF
jgi:hypothetical protein